MKVFGCVSYIHIDSTTKSKLDAKSKRYFLTRYGNYEFGIVLGWSSSKGYQEQGKFEVISLKDLLNWVRECWWWK